MKLYIDFGGTWFRYQLDNQDIHKISSQNIDLVSFLENTLENNSQIDTVNISFAGLVNDGKIISSPNIKIKPIDIKKHIQNKYDIKLNIQNDLNCAALAEKQKINSQSIALFYIGTGFGGAFIDKNSLILGSRNQSGEIGHIPFKKTPFTCGCGRDDCLELSVSGSGIKKWLKYYNIKEKYNHFDTLLGYDNKYAKEIIDNFYEGLVYAFHTSLNLFDFDTLILGGAIGKNKSIEKILKEEFKKCAFGKEDLKILISKMDEGSLEGTKYL